MLNRRRFIQLGAGAAVTAWVAGCSSSGTGTSPTSERPPTTAPPTSAGPTSTTGSTSMPTAAPTTTAETAAPAPSAAGRTLVVVQLNGGNDALNTLVPIDGRYRDARPTLGIPEADLVALAGTTDWSLHPSLATLTPFWDAGELAMLPGIGFPDPNHSHFVSLDRWWRADDSASSTGWLGRSVAAGELVPLYATALGSGAPLLRSDLFQAATVLQPSGFVFPDELPADVIGRLSSVFGADPLTALAQRSLLDTIGAVQSFSGLLTPEESDDDVISYREGGVDLASGLDLAARLVTGDVGTRIVVVSVGGFDTHSNQLATHAQLLADLAAGIDTFHRQIAEAGLSESTMLVTTSEFGRRVGENASGGFDHGAGGVSMMFGPMVRGGVLTDIDLGDQLDGDVRPTIDPRTMYTACLDWLGLDVGASFGRRYDEVELLR